MGNETHVLRERLVAKRASPVVLLVDRGMQLRDATASGSELWERYGRAIVTLLRIHRPELNARREVAAITPDASHAIRINALRSDGGYVVLLDRFQSRDPLRDLTERYSLTRRERDVARLLLDGASTLEIAQSLSIAPSTAIIHVKSILAKTGSRTRAAAVGRIVHRDGDGLLEESTEG